MNPPPHVRQKLIELYQSAMRTEATGPIFDPQVIAQAVELQSALGMTMPVEAIELQYDHVSSYRYAWLRQPNDHLALRLFGPKRYRLIRTALRRTLIPTLAKHFGCRGMHNNRFVGNVYVTNFESLCELEDMITCRDGQVSQSIHLNRTHCLNTLRGVSRRVDNRRDKSYLWLGGFWRFLHHRGLNVNVKHVTSMTHRYVNHRKNRPEYKGKVLAHSEAFEHHCFLIYRHFAMMSDEEVEATTSSSLHLIHGIENDDSVIPITHMADLWKRRRASTPNYNLFR